MDYEKKYKETLALARDYYKANLKLNKADENLILEDIFPELAESEDERIRKEIVRFIQMEVEDEIVGNKWLAWLERQGEQKPTLPKWKYKNDNTPLLRDSLILNKYGCVAKSPSGAFVNDVWVIDYDELAKLPKEELEKQDKQKETLCDKCRKAQPSHSCQDITELGRCYVEHEQKSDNSYCQENCKGFQQTGKCFADGDCEAKREAESTDKVEQSSINEITIPFGAKDSELQEATYFIPKGFHAEIDDDKVVIKKGEKPAAWSKKDEKMFEYALNMIEWYSGKNEDKSRFVSDWLKSIKQRIGG